MNVTLCSAFRDAMAYLPRYFEQIAGLRAALEARGDCLTLIVGEGDSIDTTEDALHLALTGGQYEATLLDVTHQGVYYGSIVHPERFKQLAYVWNEIWSAIQSHSDVVIFCESDLVWEAETMLALIDRLADYPAVAPMVMLERAGYPPPFFYDIWAYRKNGASFAQRPPYFDGWPQPQPVQIDSAGSCIAFRAEMARGLLWSEKNLIAGLCEQVYAKGGSVWLDPNVSVQHH